MRSRPRPDAGCATFRSRRSGSRPPSPDDQRRSADERDRLKPLLAAALAFAAPGRVAQETVVRVNVFPGLSRTLPIFIGLERGIFARHGLKVELQNTPNSRRAARGARGRQVRDRTCGGRQRGGDGGDRRPGHDHRHRRRREHERLHGPPRDRHLRGHPRQSGRGRRAEHRVCAGREEDPEEQRPARGPRLHGAPGRRHGAALGGDGVEPGPRRGDGERPVLDHRSGRRD